MVPLTKYNLQIIISLHFYFRELGIEKVYHHQDYNLVNYINVSEKS